MFKVCWFDTFLVELMLLTAVLQLDGSYTVGS